MMHNAGQDKKFWAEAFCVAVMIRNRSSTVSVDNMTPYECFYRRKPDVSHFKVFGCKAYMHGMELDLDVKRICTRNGIRRRKNAYLLDIALQVKDIDFTIL